MITDPRDTSPPGGLRAREAAAAVREGRVGAQALLDEARRRMDAWEPGLGAVVARADETARQTTGALAGVVTGVKDLIWVRGVPRRCGAPELTDDAPAPADAEAVARLREAGATMAATLATHQFAYGIVTPQTRNPLAPGQVAGGSSGGSAAAVAAGLVHVALGTDTGGSVRIPAACCGVVGVKPTFGAVPVAGVQPLAPSLDTVGVLTADVDDAALAVPVLLDRALPAPEGDLRVGVPLQTRQAVLDGQVRERWERLCATLRGQGVRVEEVDLPALADAPRANGLLLGLEALETHGALLTEHPDGWWPDVRERLERARALTPEDRRWAEHIRDSLRTQLEAVFTRVHVLLTPTLPCRVPAAGASHVRIGGREEAVTPAMTRLTNPWNLAGAPAGSLPAGRDSGGAPIGMQVIAPWHAEHVLLGAMRLIQETGGE